MSIVGVAIRFRIGGNADTILRLIVEYIDLLAFGNGP